MITKSNLKDMLTCYWLCYELQKEIFTRSPTRILIV